MPRTALPPTPASSTDIHGQDGTKHMESLQLAFELPPAAMHSADGSRSQPSKMKTPESPISQTSLKTPYPIQPSEAVKSRKRSSAALAASNASSKDSFALPPPPTRSRKIIQMKPRTNDARKPAESAAAGAGKGSTSTTKKSSASSAATPAAASPATEAPSSKKKQPSATSVAGRKIARKTAHSLIERRRRSKMNEEFAVLKSMIPACNGEMHKLAILQASIEYVRYLHDCIDKLKAQRENTSPDILTSPDNTPTDRPQESHDRDGGFHPTSYTPEEEQLSPDVEMIGSDEPISPTFTAYPSSIGTRSHHSTESPSIAAQDSTTSPVIPRNGSYSSVCTTVENQRHYSFSTATASPAFGPQQMPTGAGWYVQGSYSASGSALTSPALGPSMERDLDQEAMAALLMLNNDRRGPISSSTGESDRSGSSRQPRGQPRGMSVKDLLSS